MVKLTPHSYRFVIGSCVWLCWLQNKRWSKLSKTVTTKAPQEGCVWVLLSHPHLDSWEVCFDWHLPSYVPYVFLFLIMGYFKKEEVKEGQAPTLLKNVFCFEQLSVCLLGWPLSSLFWWVSPETLAEQWLLYFSFIHPVKVQYDWEYEDRKTQTLIPRIR